MRNRSRVSNLVIGEAIERYLAREGLDIIDRGCTGLVDFVCRERGSGAVVFIGCTAGEGTDDSQEDFERWKVEEEMVNYIAQTEKVADATKVRFDTIHVFVTSGSKGMIRHHVAATEQGTLR